MKIDVLAFGSHPDDVELGCAGTLLMEKRSGKTIGVIDITGGELGTRGTPATRKAEAAAAAGILQLDIRENLGLPDGFFENTRPHQLEIIRTIRKYRPEIILCNAPADRHPDHGRASRLLEEASFLSGLIKVETEDKGQLQTAWRPKYVLHYLQDRYLQPNFVYDITPVMEQKIEAIKAYGTQFNVADPNALHTYISKPDFLDSIIYRAKMLGKMIGVPYAEGYISEKMIGIRNLDALVQEVT